MRNFKHTAATKQVGAAVLAALLVGGAATTVAPAPNSAVAAESGQIRVDLRAAVGEEWFDKIGDREVKLELVNDARPTPDQLQTLDIPKIKKDDPGKLKTVATATTKDGVAEFTGLDTGVYLVSVADGADPADKRVSYAPFVVAVTPANQNQTVAPKAQEVGVTVDPLTACNTPGWKDAAAPGSYVEYDFVSTVPNLSKDGSLGKYGLTLKFSPGHTVKWQDGNVRNVIALGRVPRGGQVDGPRTFTAAAGKVAVLAQGEVPRKKAPVEKLEAPRLTVRGAGESIQLTKGVDYTEKQNGNDSAAFELTEKGRQTLARLKALDAATTVDTWVPAKANAQGPWGSGPVRDAVLGDLEATATLLTDGMDETRAPITVEHTNHINVVSRPKCFRPAGGSATATAAPGEPSATVTSTATETERVTATATATEHVTNTATATERVTDTATATEHVTDTATEHVTDTAAAPTTTSRSGWHFIPLPIPLPLPLPGRGSTSTGASSAPTTVTEIVSHETTGPDGVKTSTTETVTRRESSSETGGTGSGAGVDNTGGTGSGSGSGSSGSGSGTGSRGSGSNASRDGDLAYTGASVIGITVIAALLILLGLWLRRREDEDDQK